jgi:hypothetical protein
VKRQNTHSSLCSFFSLSEEKERGRIGGFVTDYRAFALFETRLASCLEEEQKNPATS